MPFVVDIDKAKADFQDFEFVSALTPSEQKAAFHVRRGADDLCLKIIAPNHSLERAQREVAAMQEIDHPNVVKLIEYVFSSKGGRTTHYMVEEFIQDTIWLRTSVQGIAGRWRDQEGVREALRRAF